LINASDRTIWDFARKNDFIIVTQDSDFNGLNSLYGFPPKLIWIRLGNLKNKELADLLIRYTDEIRRFALDKNLGCFEIFRS
jgi:predicted nuclease of predicted toxin-antitoxin system